MIVDVLIQLNLICLIMITIGFFGTMLSLYRSSSKLLLIMLVFLGVGFGGLYLTDSYVSSVPSVTTPGYTYYTSTPEYQPIASLKDGSVSYGQGRFFLGIGSTRQTEKPQYVYYKILPDGYYSLGTTTAEGVLIKEDGGEYPYIEIRENYYTTDKITYTPNGFENWTTGGVSGRTWMNPITTIFHVPNGTIIKEYTLDSELKR